MDCGRHKVRPACDSGVRVRALGLLAAPPALHGPTERGGPGEAVSLPRGRGTRGSFPAKVRPPKVALVLQEHLQKASLPRSPWRSSHMSGPGPLPSRSVETIAKRCKDRFWFAEAVRGSSRFYPISFGMISGFYF